MDLAARKKQLGQKTSQERKSRIPSEKKKTTTPLSPTLRRRLEEIASVERSHKKHAWEEEVIVDTGEKNPLHSKVPPTPSWLFSRIYLTGEFILSKGRSSSYPAIVRPFSCVSFFLPLKEQHSNFVCMCVCPAGVGRCDAFDERFSISRSGGCHCRRAPQCIARMFVMFSNKTKP
jgi:hypothetical protein